MATNVIYQPPSAAQWARIATNPKIRAALGALAERGKGFAEALAPRDTGRYSAAFEVRADTVTLSGHPRAAAVLVNTVPYAAEVEIRHRVLARTGDLLST